MQKYGRERYKNIPEQGWLSIETIVVKCGKTLHNNYQAT